MNCENKNMGKSLTAILAENSEFVFYGARATAFGAYIAIKNLWNRSPVCFVVNNLENNPKCIDEFSVKKFHVLPKDMLIIIAAAQWYQQEIVEDLKKSGYENTWALTVREEYQLMSQYFQKIGKFPVAVTSKDDTSKDFLLFEVRNHLDKPLQHPPQLAAWETPIQAGAELTDLRICNLLDNTGNNISSKNRYYSEASVMYWIWKNVKSTWVGVEHYRRHILVTPDLLTSAVDAIVTLPYICYPDFATHVSWTVGRDVVDTLIDALETLYPNEGYASHLYGQYFYPCNLIVAQKSVYDDLCEWIFGVTAYIEKLNLEHTSNPRVLGYIVEQLTSIYFTANKNNLNIKHVEKAIYT